MMVIFDIDGYVLCNPRQLSENTPNTVWRPYLSKNVTHSSRTTPYLCYDLTTLEL